MKKFIQTLLNNKEWIFSGLGVFLISSLLPFSWESLTSKKDRQDRDSVSTGNQSSVVQFEGSAGDITINQSPVPATKSPAKHSERNNIEFSPVDFLNVKVIETEGGWGNLNSNLEGYKKCGKLSRAEQEDASDCFLFRRFLS